MLLRTDLLLLIAMDLLHSLNWSAAVTEAVIAVFYYLDFYNCLRWFNVSTKRDTADLASLSSSTGIGYKEKSSLLLFLLPLNEKTAVEFLQEASGFLFICFRFYFGFVFIKLYARRFLFLVL